MNERDGGCTNFWCLDYRTRVAHRADLAERAVSGLTREVRALRNEIGRLKEPPEPQYAAAEEYVEFKAKAWILFGVIMILIGAALLGVVFIVEHISATTTFNDVRKPG